MFINRMLEVFGWFYRLFEAFCLDCIDFGAVIFFFFFELTPFILQQQRNGINFHISTE